MTPIAHTHHDSPDDELERAREELAAEEMLNARWASPVVATPVPDLVDLYVPEGPAFVWLRWSLRGWDLELVAAGREQIGVEPEWLREARDYDGFDGILGKPLSLYVEQGGFHVAAILGVAPGQPFLVRIDPPEYDSDGDAAWTWHLVRRALWAREQAGRSWTRALAKAAERREQHARKVAARRELRRTDVAALYIQRDHWWPRGTGYGASAGAICRLVSSHDHFALAEGRNDGGDWEKALAQLVEHARVELPHLTEEQIRALPVRW